MQLRFYKYQGTGNDFMMLDGREQDYSFLDQEQIARLCHRRFGIGADGLIILNHRDGYDFEMVYFNSDGRQSSMCGNGGRCIVRFANDLGIERELYRFKAIDGDHLARVEGDAVSLQMRDVAEVNALEGSAFFLDTGSPHYVRFQANLSEGDFISDARHIRQSEPYRAEGVNVNFVAPEGDVLHMRTYERGVEDETYSCGTGVTAAALSAHHAGKISATSVRVETTGGTLRVSFEQSEGAYHNIWLNGPASRVFEGQIEL